MTACPSDAELAAHLGGDLAAEAAAALGLHLDGCADCRATVIALVRARCTPAGELRPARAAPAIGDAVGRYRLTRVLGAGGMGVVYAAEPYEKTPAYPPHRLCGQHRRRPTTQTVGDVRL